MAIQMFPVKTTATLAKDVAVTPPMALAADMLPATPAGVPTTLAELTMADSFTSTLSASAALSLGFTVGSINVNGATSVCIQDTILYKDVTGPNNQHVRYGVGTRCIVSVTTMNASANISSVPFIAASAQFGLATAQAEFEVLGLQSPAIIALLPQPKDLNIDTYTDFQSAASSIKKLITDPATVVTPQILSVTVDVSDGTDYEAAIARAWALVQIRDNHSMLDAQSKHADSSAHFKDTIRLVYLDVANITSPAAQPSDVARARARQLLLGWDVSS